MESLKCFRASLLNAWELYPCAAEMLKYHFANGAFDTFIAENFLSITDAESKRAVKEAVADIATIVFDSTRNAARAIANQLKIEIDITKGTNNWKVYDSGSVLRSFENFCVLFAAIYSARSIRDLFELKELEELDTLKPVLEKLLSTLKKQEIDVHLPENVLALFGQAKRTPNSQLCFSHLDRIYKVDLASPSEVKKEKVANEVLTKWMEIVDSAENRRFSLTDMEEASAMNLNGNLEKDLVLRFCEGALATLDSVDIRVSTAYLPFLKTVFGFATEEDIDEIVRSFFKVCRQKRGELPNFKKTYKKFSADFVSAMSIMGDQIRFQKDETLLGRVTHEFAFLFLIAPKPTLWDVLVQCVHNKLIVPNILRVLRKLQSILELKESVNVGDSPEEKGDMSLLVVALRRMLMTEVINCQDIEKRQNFAYLVTALTRERRSVVKKPGEGEEAEYGGVLDEQVITGAELLRGFLLPALFKRIEVEMMLDILLRCVGELGAKRTPILWTTKVDNVDIAERSYFASLPAPMLLATLIDILRENDSKKEAIESSCLKCLSALGFRFKEDQVIFDEETRTFLLNKLNGHKWTFKYAVCSWFAESLANPKLQIPSGLYASLGKEIQEHYEPIVVDFDYSPAECFFRSVFELGRTAPKLAIEFIKQGISQKPSDEDIRVKVCQSLYDSIDESVTHDKIVSLYEVLRELLIALDTPLEPLLSVSTTESTFHGLRLVNALLVLGEAVVMAKVLCDEAQESDVARRQRIADLLLVAFCQISKNHLEREVVDLRRSRYRFPPTIREPRAIADGLKIDRYVRVFTQLAQLFCFACCLSREYEQPPSQLHVLLTLLTDYLSELQRMEVGPTLDSMKAISRAGSVVYAVAKPQNGSLSATENGEVNRDEKGIDNHHEGETLRRSSMEEGSIKREVTAESEATPTDASITATNPVFEINASAQAQIPTVCETNTAEGERREREQKQSGEEGTAVASGASHVPSSRRPFNAGVMRRNDGNFRGGFRKFSNSHNQYGRDGHSFRPNGEMYSNGRSSGVESNSYGRPPFTRGGFSHGTHQSDRVEVNPPVILEGAGRGMGRGVARGRGQYLQHETSHFRRDFSDGGAPSYSTAEVCDPPSWSHSSGYSQQTASQPSTKHAEMSNLNVEFKVVSSDVLKDSDPLRQNFASNFLSAAAQQVPEGRTRDTVENKLNEPRASNFARTRTDSGREFEGRAENRAHRTSASESAPNPYAAQSDGAQNRNANQQGRNTKNRKNKGNRGRPNK